MTAVKANHSVEVKVLKEAQLPILKHEMKAVQTSVKAVEEELLCQWMCGLFFNANDKSRKQKMKGAVKYSHLFCGKS